MFETSSKVKKQSHRSMKQTWQALVPFVIRNYLIGLINQHKYFLGKLLSLDQQLQNRCGSLNAIFLNISHLSWRPPNGLECIRTLGVHYVDASANLNWQYSKCGNVPHMHYFCITALQMTQFGQNQLKHFLLICKPHSQNMNNKFHRYSSITFWVQYTHENYLPLCLREDFRLLTPIIEAWQLKSFYISFQDTLQHENYLSIGLRVYNDNLGMVPYTPF